jgi:hypothetical protein
VQHHIRDQYLIAGKSTAVPVKKEEEMKKAALSIVGLLLITMMASCATYTAPITATGLPMGTKTGEASGVLYFWIFGDDSDANIAQAAKNGRITKISSVDFRVNNFLNIVQNVTCVVTGE